MASAQLAFGPIVAGAGNSSENTGVAVSGTLTFETVGTVGTLTYRLNNLSDGIKYTYGDITGFSIGFNTTEFEYMVGSFSILNGDTSFELADVGMREIGFSEGDPTGPGAYVLDVAVRSDSNALALWGGYWAEFEFQFDILDGAAFDPVTFFDAAPLYGLTWRMQSVGGDQEGSVAGREGSSPKLNDEVIKAGTAGRVA